MANVGKPVSPEKQQELRERIASEGIDAVARAHNATDYLTAKAAAGAGLSRTARVLFETDEGRAA
jgi:hypothetical protein